MHVRLEKKMERLMDDAVNIRNLLPWIESDEDIINFMRKIPLDKSHLRNQLTLRYFFKKRDCYSDGFVQEIENDAREIVVIMPQTSYKEIKEKLIILGNMPNRKEVVLRQLLNKKRDLDNVLKEIIVGGTVKKRKTESGNDIFGLDSSNNHTNINIKIRKVDGSLEVVSRISSQELPSTSQCFTDRSEDIYEPTTSSTSIASTSTSTTHSTNGSPDSTVPSTTTEADYQFSGISDQTSTFDGLINTDSQPSTSESEIPISNLMVPAVNNKIGCAKMSKVGNSEVIEVPQSSGDDNSVEVTEIPYSTLSNEVKTEKEPEFDLIGFLKELSSASEYKIYKLCKKMKLNLHVRPDEDMLTYLLNQLLDDVVEIGSGGSIDSNSDTEEYNYIDDLPRELISVAHVNKNEESRSNDADMSSNANSNNKKEFKLKEPILTLTSQTTSKFNTDPFPILQMNPQIQTSPSIIQPARFNPPSPRENTIPAMPSRYLEVLNTRVYNTGTGYAEADNEPLPGVLNTDMNLAGNENNESPIPMQVIEEPVAGPSNVKIEKKRVLDQNLFLRMIEMFPEACPEYIRDVCDGRKWEDLDDVVTIILSAPSYPKRPERVPSPPKEVDPEKQYEIIKELLPDADPTYIRMQCERFANDEKGLKQFINSAMEVKDYPTMKEYLRKQQLSAQQKQYTTEFNIENFIQLFPDPEKTFNDPKRSVQIESYSSHYVNIFFKNRYDRISAKVIQNVLIQYDFKVLECDRVFGDMIKRNNTIKSRRKPSPLPENLQNIPLLQELAYITHKEEVRNYLLEKQKREEEDRIFAKDNGLMETCQCCYDDEVMPKDTFMCPSGCKFCKDCIKKSCEVALGEGKTDFPCLADCSTEFALQTLQSVLPPKMFSKLAQKKALAEIKAAGIEELETCPFCDFASIPNEADRIFRCLNPDCMKESCRKCKEPNHVPLKCEEVEKDQDVKARTYIENKMTEALIRKCWKCGTSFFKEEGCNKMTCSCGATMCYICKQPVKDYSHFNGIGGDKYERCPLYSNTNLVNQQNVLKAAEAAKAEIDPSKLKVDPTLGIKDHFKKRGKKLPREPHLDALDYANRNNVPHHHGHRHRHRQQLHEMQGQGVEVLQGNDENVVGDRRYLEGGLRFIDAREEIPGVRIERGGRVQRDQQQRLIRERYNDRLQRMYAGAHHQYRQHNP